MKWAVRGLVHSCSDGASASCKVRMGRVPALQEQRCLRCRR